MIKIERQLLKEKILENDCRLEKMFTALILIYISLKMQAGSKKFQSILIACSASIINVWITKYIKQFSTDFRLYIVHRSKIQTSDFWCKDFTVDFSAFVDFLNFFDEINILTIRIMILTAYDTWAKRSLKITSTSYKKIVIEAATDDHNKQTSFKVIDSNNFVNDFEESNNKTLSKNDDMINNNEDKCLFLDILEFILSSLSWFNAHIKENLN